MSKEKDSVSQEYDHEPSLDRIDRKLLGALAEDASISYAELGKLVALSAPATHERVKRLRRSGVIQRTTIQIDPKLIGKFLLAFIHVDTKGWGKTPELMKIASYPEVEEIHSVAGDTSMLLKVRTRNTHALEEFLSSLYDIPGVVATSTYVVLSTYLERSVQSDN